jgi:hypothetical protein
LADSSTSPVTRRSFFSRRPCAGPSESSSAEPGLRRVEGRRCAGADAASCSISRRRLRFWRSRSEGRPFFLRLRGGGADIAEPRAGCLPIAPQPGERASELCAPRFYLFSFICFLLRPVFVRGVGLRVGAWGWVDFSVRFL